MVTTTVATVITMIATMFAYYFGRFVGSRDKVDIIVDSTLKRLEKDGFIRTKKGKDGEVELIKINEILALGPSISVLMDGYQDKNVTSLRGTLIPAKTLNKMISRIPLIGDIIIPKEVGEGLFGISFKMKGPKGKIKTGIELNNPTKKRESVFSNTYQPTNIILKKKQE